MADKKAHSAREAEKLAAVHQACKLAPDHRTDHHINDIMDCVQNVKFFGKLTHLQQRALCRTMTLETFEPRQIIFQKGDFGDKFYIVLVGSVSVHIENAGTAVNQFDKRTLEKGTGFGEIALQHDQPRSATVSCNESTEALVTKRADYEKYAGQLHRLFIQQRVRFLRQFPRIEDALQRCIVSTQDIAAMANCLNEMCLSGGEMLVRQGDPVDNMIFVRKGQLAMLRLVDLDVPKEADGRPCAPPEKSSKRTRCRTHTDSQDTLEEVESPKRAGQEYIAKWAKMLADSKQRSKEAQEQAKKGKKTQDDTEDRAKGIKPLGKDKLDSISRSNKAGWGPTGIESKPLVGGPAAGHVALVGGGGPDATRHAHRGTVTLQRRMTTMKSTLSNVGPTRAQELWAKVRYAFRTVMLLNSLSGQTASDSNAQQDSGTRHLANFMDVSAARLKFAEYRSKELQVSKGKRPAGGKRASAMESSASKDIDPLDDPFGSLQSGATSVQTSMTRGPRRKLLHIGNIGPMMYFGDRQVSTGQVYPVSLVSDPTADIYMMSKTDIQRRLPKKLFATLFTPDKEEERWQNFRRNMHGEAMASRQSQALRVPRPLRDPRSRSRVDPVANLDFLGVRPDAAPDALPPPQRCNAPLTARDEEQFSQSSAEFLRKFGRLRKDRELRHVLVQQGLRDRHWDEVDEDTPDPMSFRFEQHWSKFGKFSTGLDSLNEDEDHLVEGGNRGARRSIAGGLLKRSGTQVANAGAGAASGAFGPTAAANSNTESLPPLPTSRSMKSAAAEIALSASAAVGFKDITASGGGGSASAMHNAGSASARTKRVTVKGDGG